MPTPIPSDVLEADRASLVALKNLKDYTAINPSYSTEALAALAEEMDQAEEAAVSAKQMYVTARAAKAALVRKFHSDILGARSNVNTQYGPDSPEIQAMGLKKKSERKRPTRRVAKSGT